MQCMHSSNLTFPWSTEQYVYGTQVLHMQEWRLSMCNAFTAWAVTCRELGSVHSVQLVVTGLVLYHYRIQLSMQLHSIMFMHVVFRYSIPLIVCIHTYNMCVYVCVVPVCKATHTYIYVGVYACACTYVHITFPFSYWESELQVSSRLTDMECEGVNASACCFPCSLSVAHAWVQSGVLQRMCFPHLVISHQTTWFQQPILDRWCQNWHLYEISTACLKNIHCSNSILHIVIF